MEKLQENLLKNGWVRAMDVPPLTHGEMTAPPSTSNLDKWLDDFESKKLNPVSGFEEIKDAKSEYIEEILAMMSSEKRIPQPDKVILDATNVRGNLLKRGWVAVPVERRDAFVASVLPVNQRKAEKTDMESIQLQEPTDDIEKLMNMLASKKVPAKPGKYRGSVDKVNINKALLKLGWTMKNDEPAASSGDFAFEKTVADKMTNLVEKWFQHFEDKKTRPIQTKATEDHITVNKDVEKILDMLSSKTVPLPAKSSQGKMDEPKRDGYRASLLTKGWYDIPNHKLREPAANTAVLDEPESNLKITTTVQQHTDTQNVLNMVRMKTPRAVVASNKGAVDKAQLKKRLLSKGWYSMHSESKDVDTVEEFSRTADEKKSNSDTPRKAEGNSYQEIDDVATEPHEAVGEIDSESSAPKPTDVNTTDVASALEGCAQKTVTTNKDAIDENVRGHVQTKSTGTKDKSPKKTRHGTDINNLVQQGWSVSKKSRHQITMVKVPESTSKDDASTASKQGSRRIQAKGRESRRDKFEAQKERKTTKTTSLEKEELSGHDGGALASAPDVSQKKKTLFRRFVRRSGKLMGRFFACGRHED